MKYTLVSLTSVDDDDDVVSIFNILSTFRSTLSSFSLSLMIKSFKQEVK